MSEILLNGKEFITNVSIIAGAGILGIALHRLLFRVLSHLHRTTSMVAYDSMIVHFRQPLRYLIPLLLINLSVPLVSFPVELYYVLDNTLRILLITSFSWLIVRSTSVAEDVILARHDITKKDNLRARRILTQVQTFRRILVVFVAIAAVSFVLMGFERFRDLGTGLLASAGLATIIIGLAAQKVFANFLAGIQIALTQPIRLDDVVIVENEWGRIEEITLTYVVVRIWDLRRLVLPISYFIEKPFQNWTKTSSELLGTVFLHTDFTVPVQEVRKELHRVLQESGKWDGHVCVLQVTGATEKTMELRALMSAPDSSTAWELRCLVREKLIEFIQTKYPDALPKTRARLQT